MFMIQIKIFFTDKPVLSFRFYFHRCGIGHMHHDLFHICVSYMVYHLSLIHILPPEMDVNYMRGRENIKKNAKAALKQLLENPDYQFVADHASFLGRIQTACMRIRPDEVLSLIHISASTARA